MRTTIRTFLNDTDSAERYAREFLPSMGIEVAAVEHFGYRTDVVATGRTARSIVGSDKFFRAENRWFGWAA